MKNPNGWKPYEFGKAVSFNPKVQFQRGEQYAFIEMDDVIPAEKNVFPKGKKVYASGSCSKFRNNDVLFARITPCLDNKKIATASIGENQIGFGSTEFIVLRAKENITIQEYVHYLSKSEYIIQNAINSYVGASGRQRADAKFIKKVIVPIPKITEQQRIASILSTYDDLIENNNKRIALLEQMAEQIYKEWFVRMRFPGYENAEFEKGVPKGWEVKTLSSIANILMGQSPKSEFYNDAGIGIPFHQGVGSYSKRFPTHDTYCSTNGRQAKEADILFSVRAPVGRINIADKKLIIGRGLGAIRHKQGFQSYLFYLLNYYFQLEDVIGNGSIFNSVGKDELNKFKILQPSNELDKKFNDFVLPMDKQLQILFQQNKVLKQTRDLLLPRLISGKLRVKEAKIE